MHHVWLIQFWPPRPFIGQDFVSLALFFYFVHVYLCFLHILTAKMAGRDTAGYKTIIMLSWAMHSMILKFPKVDKVVPIKVQESDNQYALQKAQERRYVFLTLIS